MAVYLGTKSKLWTHCWQLKFLDFSPLYCIYTLDPLIYLSVHHVTLYSLILGKPHGCVFCIRVYFLLSCIWLKAQLDNWFILYYSFIMLSILKFLQEQNTGSIFQLCCAIFLQPWCWESPLGPSHHGSVQTDFLLMVHNAIIDTTTTSLVESLTTKWQ